MISPCPQPFCSGVMTLVKENYVCDCCCHSRPVVAAGAVLQYQLFSRFPVRIPSKSPKRSKVEQKSKDVFPARRELFSKSELVGVIEE